MSTSAEIRRKRGTAKGNVTKAATSITTLTGLPPSRLDITQIKRLRENIYRAEESFASSHQAILETISDTDTDQLQAEEVIADEFDQAVAKQIDILQILQDQHHSFHLHQRIETQLDGYENLEKDDVVSILPKDLPKLERLFDEFVDSLSTPGARDLADMKGYSRDLRRRITRLKTSLPTPHESSSTSPSTSTRSCTSATKLPPVSLPTFDGNYLEWPSFLKRFEDVLSKYPELTESDKVNYLHSSLKTKEAQDLVVEEIRNNSYSSMMLKLDRQYHRPRKVFRHLVQRINDFKFSADNSKVFLNAHTKLFGDIDALKRSAYCEWGRILVAQIESQMSREVFMEWSKYTADEEDVPSIETLREFTAKRCLLLENSKTASESTSSKPPSSHNVQSSNNKKPKPVIVATKKNNCIICHLGDHSVAQCETFKNYNLEEKKRKIKQHKLCFNCLSLHHRVEVCTSKYSCRLCGQKHHSLLHRNDEPTSSTKPEVAPPTQVSTVAASKVSPTESQALLQTCQVLVKGPGGTVRARALIDSGASLSLVTNRLVKQVKAPRQRRLTALSGIQGVSVPDSQFVADLELVPTTGRQDQRVYVKPAILERIISNLPTFQVRNITDLPNFAGLPLADPNIGKAGRVDLLLGMDVIAAIQLDNVKRCAGTNLIAYQTIFGWTVGGTWTSNPNNQPTQAIYTLQASQPDPGIDLKKFWELEEPPNTTKLSPEEQLAVDLFQTSHRRTSAGRYIVTLPKKQPTSNLGCSREQATRRYIINERSLQRRGTWNEFQAVVQEYFTLGHAEKVPNDRLTIPENQTFYLPMHGVVKPSSTTTKLRVVFDASAKTTTGISLNDILLPGPCLYPKITDVLIKFRLHRVAVSADISKMFREVELNENDRDLHRFLWRPQSGEPLQEARMTRLTFGVTSSPFLATQVLRQVAIDHQSQYPAASKVVREDFYVDDCLTGAASEEEAIQLREELNSLLNCAGMTLRKWRSSSDRVLSSIPEDLLEKESTKPLPLPQGFQKTLGIHWNTQEDTFYVAIPTANIQSRTTKRTIASQAAQVFDLLGFHSPSILFVKILLQKLWQLKLDWDDPVPEPVLSDWQKWREDLHLLTKHPITRCYFQDGKSVQQMELHGFSDASESAYAAVVYLRVLYQDSTVSTTLVMAKSKVAPLKHVTIPKLELCGALLLSELLFYVCHVLNFSTESVYAWTDSSIVLHWLQTSRLLKSFVANRVSQIINYIPVDRWRHVPTKSNPADIASRGCLPSQLITSEMWWLGPPWLSQSPILWPENTFSTVINLPETRKPQVVVTATITTYIPDKFSSFSLLLGTIARIRRFVYNARRSKDLRNLCKNLSADEINAAEILILKLHQQREFSEEKKDVMSGRPVSNHSSLRYLNPIVGGEGLLRVGGRLKNSHLTSSQKHPAIVKGNSHLSRLIVEHYHRQHHHAGPSLLIGIISAMYFITGARKVIRDVTRACVTCKRHYAKTLQQQMGQLPESRVSFTSPFAVTGVDFAGPFSLKLGRIRKPVIVKGYVSLFVCFATKAVHLEIVTDLSTESFIAALRRFIAIRSAPSEIISDNGTNFVGAARELKDVYDFLNNQQTTQSIAKYFTSRRIKWTHIPSRSPNFGGLWETAVKSVKALLRKVIGSNILSYEEFDTLAKEISADLNSRPLIQMDSSPEDGVEPLTPGHFIALKPLVALPDNLPAKNIACNKRWSLVQRLSKDFWNRWSTEYIQTLNRYTKWCKPTKNYSVGDVVLCKDLPETPRRTWPLARIVATHPGEDSLVRVVTVLAGGKRYKRPTSKLILLVEEPPSSTSAPPQDGPA